MYDFEFPAPESLSAQEIDALLAKTEAFLKAVTVHQKKQLMTLLERVVL